MKTQNSIKRPLFAACASATLLFVSSAVAQNVGIGVSNPQSKLTINGTTASGGIAVGDSTYNVAAPLDGAIIQGNVGVGTTAPISKLHIFDANGPVVVVEGGGSPQIQIRNDSTTGFRSFFNMGDATLAKGFTLAVDNGANNTNSFSILDRAAGVVTRFFIDPNGNTGIGTSTPLATLHVVPSSGSITRSSGNLANLTPNGVQTGSSGGGSIGPVSIYANGAIASGNNIYCSTFQSALTFTASDLRTKDIIGISDSAKDLETLNKLKITDYTMKDKFLLGDKPFKKVIAQDVEAVFPQAVRKVVKSVPDVMQSATAKEISKGEFQLLLPKDSGLKAGEVVEIFNKDDTPETVRIRSTEGTGITVALRCVGDGEDVFIYGHQVNDFGIVDYEALSMLNVSATQELAKKSAAQDVKIAEQNARIKVLEAENAKLAAIVSKMDSLEKAVNALQTKAAERVAISESALSE